MKVFTSYFGKKLPESIVRVSISVYPPKWFVGQEMKELAPHPYMIKKGYPEADYIRRYKEILSGCNRVAVLEKLALISGGKDVALCCWEKPGDFCHRHMVADWLNEEVAGVTEYGEQMKLF